jgi:hypothetical protein
VQYYKELQSIHGGLVLSNPSVPVLRVLKLAGLGEMFARVGPVAAVSTDTETIEQGSCRYVLSRLAAGAGMSCSSIGKSELIAGRQFRPEDVRHLRCTPGIVALGLGAFGEDYESCCDRFGEFLTVAGAAAYLPTDGTNVPDYMLPATDLVPDVTMVYGLVCEGDFALHARFETTSERGPVNLSELAADCLGFAGSDTAVVVIAAESAGLMGTCLRKSPARAAVAGAPFSYPEVREWLSFSPERIFTRSVVLAAGVTVRSAEGPFKSLLRPLGRTGPVGHFHAAAFSYRPLRKAQTRLSDSVQALFEGEVLEGVLHLLADDRGSSEPTESQFLRGACWVAPITHTATEGKHA